MCVLLIEKWTPYYGRKLRITDIHANKEVQSIMTRRHDGCGGFAEVLLSVGLENKEMYGNC